MSENLFCPGQRSVTQMGKDGWYRTFCKYPKMSESVKGMLRKWAKSDNHTKMLIFFLKKCEYSEDYSWFLIREFDKGRI